MVLVSLQIMFFYTHFDFEWKYSYEDGKKHLVQFSSLTIKNIFLCQHIWYELILNSSTIVIVMILLLYNSLIRKKQEMMICNILHNLVSNFGLFVVCQGMKRQNNQLLYLFVQPKVVWFCFWLSVFQKREWFDE